MAEKEYIELETVKRHIRHLIQDPWNHQAAPASWADAYRQMIDILDDEPAADVRPVKRGEWGSDMSTAKCEHCGHAFPAFMRLYNYCPNCGADMRPEEDNHG